MEIRELELTEINDVIKLQADCFTEEINGLSDEVIDINENKDYWLDWKLKEDKSDDIRTFLGAFDNNKLIGVIIGSFVNSKHSLNLDFELNGFWIDKKYRNNGISLLLLKEILNRFYVIGSKKIIVYNFHYSPSNSYYRMLGLKVIKTETQLKEKVPVDIFEGEIINILSIINKKCLK